MASTSSTTGQHGQIESPQVWTLVLTGGLPFQLALPMTPMLDHDGGRTVWKMWGVEQMVLQMEQAIKEACQASIEHFTETQTAEQKYERMEILGLEG